MRDDNRRSSRRSSTSCRPPTTRPTTPSGGKSLYYGTEAARHRLRHRPRGQGLLRPAAVRTRRRRATGSSGPTSNCSTGSSSRATTSPTPTTSSAPATPAAARTQNRRSSPATPSTGREEEFNAFKAARDAGVNIASLQRQHRLLEGPLRERQPHPRLLQDGRGQTARAGSGAVSPTTGARTGSSRHRRRRARRSTASPGTADDNPQNSTTTWRDNGAPPGDPNAPPGGRVGPDMPENQLFGSHVRRRQRRTQLPGDRPAGERQRRVRRRSRLAQHRHLRERDDQHRHQPRRLGVGRDPDPGPVPRPRAGRRQARSPRPTSQALGAATTAGSRTRVALRNTSPPPGQPGTVGAVKYTAPSGALVFASGTMRWSLRPRVEDDDPRIEQATYNIFSDMGVQPDTPARTHARPGRLQPAPIASSFTLSPTRSATTTSGHLRRLGLQRPRRHDRQIRMGPRRQRQLSRPTPAPTRSRPTPTPPRANSTCALRVTDNGGATDVTVRTLTVIDNQPRPPRSRSRPNPAIVGQPVSFDALGLQRPRRHDRQVRMGPRRQRHLRDRHGLDADRRRHPTRRPGTVHVGLRVTDNGGKTATTTVPVTVSVGGVSSYRDAVLDTPGLLDYWRMGESSGHRPSPTASAPARRPPPAASTLGVPGGVAGDPNTAARFDGVDDAATRRPSTSPGTTHGHASSSGSKWTPTPTTTAGDGATPRTSTTTPAASWSTPTRPGSAAASASASATATRATTPTSPGRAPASGTTTPSSSTPAAPAAQQITPYVDGQPVTYTKTRQRHRRRRLRQLDPLLHVARRELGCSAAATSTRWRSTTAPSSAATIAEHYGELRHQPPADRVLHRPRPIPSSRARRSPSTPRPPATPTARSPSTNGTSTATAATRPTPARARRVSQHLRRREGQRQRRPAGHRQPDRAPTTTTRTVDGRSNQPPTAVLHRQPEPGRSSASRSRFDASGSTDPDGTIAKYEWDLDGNGSYETNTGHDRDRRPRLSTPPAPSTSACGSPTTAARRRRRRCR